MATEVTVEEAKPTDPAISQMIGLNVASDDSNNAAVIRSLKAGWIYNMNTAPGTPCLVTFRINDRTTALRMAIRDWGKWLTWPLKQEIPHTPIAWFPLPDPAAPMPNA